MVIIRDKLTLQASKRTLMQDRHGPPCSAICTWSFSWHPHTTHTGSSCWGPAVASAEASASAASRGRGGVASASTFAMAMAQVGASVWYDVVLRSWLSTWMDSHICGYNWKITWHNTIIQDSWVSSFFNVNEGVMPPDGRFDASFIFQCSMLCALGSMLDIGGLRGLGACFCCQKAFTT